MGIHNVAIVGLGRVGSAFLEKVVSRKDVISVKCVCELYDTPGRRLAEKENISVAGLDELIGFGVGLDIIFDLTGDENVTLSLRRKLEKAGNTYTKVAQNRLARLVWDLLGEDEQQAMPDVGIRKSQAYADMIFKDK